MEPRFLSSRSHALGFAPAEEKGTSLMDRVRNALSPPHIAGTASMLISEYTIAKTLAGAWKERDWLRIASSIGGMSTTATFALSSREGTYPEGETFPQRFAETIKHMDRYAIHASYIYGLIPTLLNYASHFYHGTTGPMEQRARLASGIIGLTSYALAWKSLFGNPDGVGRTAKKANLEKQDTLFKFMLHDPEGLVSRLLPIAIRVTAFVEGQMKVNRGIASGHDFRTSAVVDMCNQLFFIGYTYQQLWKAHKQKHFPQQTRNWVEKILDEQEKKPQSSQNR